MKKANITKHYFNNKGSQVFIASEPRVAGKEEDSGISCKTFNCSSGFFNSGSRGNNLNGKIVFGKTSSVFKNTDIPIGKKQNNTSSPFNSTLYKSMNKQKSADSPKEKGKKLTGVFKGTNYFDYKLLQTQKLEQVPNSDLNDFINVMKTHVKSMTHNERMHLKFIEAMRKRNDNYRKEHRKYLSHDFKSS